MQILHIRADYLRSKACTPIRGSQKGKMNPAVERDRSIADQMISFKYPSAIKNEGNVQQNFYRNKLCDNI